MSEKVVVYEVEAAGQLAAAEAERAVLMAIIAMELSQADRHTIAIEGAIEVLEEAGTFKHAPLGEQWTKRGNETKYLYLTFRRDRWKGTYQGPGNKKRLYVGVKEAKIAAARARVARTVRRDELKLALGRHKGFCDVRRRELNRLAEAAARWERADLETGLVAEREEPRAELEAAAVDLGWGALGCPECEEARDDLEAESRA